MSTAAPRIPSSGKPRPITAAPRARRAIGESRTTLGLIAASLVVVAGAGLAGYRLSGGHQAERRSAATDLRETVNATAASPSRNSPLDHPSAGREIGPQGGARPPASLEEARRSLDTASNVEAKRAAADALIALGTEEALSAWGLALLAESDPAKRAAMMDALDNLNGELAVEMVTQLIELSDAPEVFEGVARTLSRMATPETPKYLVEIASSSTPQDGRRERALRMLGAIENPAAVPGLIQVAHQPALGIDVTGQASVSLGKIGDLAAVTALAGAFDTLSPDDFAQRQQLLAALGAVTNPESRALLTDLAANSPQPLVAAAAADALKNLPPAAAEEAVHTDAPSLPVAGELLGKAVTGF